MTAKPLASFWEEAKKNLHEAANKQNLAFYSAAVIAFIALSIALPNQDQVYLSIAAGITVALLLAAPMILSRGIAALEVAFIGGIIFLLAALFKRGLLPRTVLEGFGHYFLILSIALTGSYVALKILRGSHSSRIAPVKSTSDFLSICWTTLSSELCSCVHPIPFLDALGIVAFLPNQVRLGFVVMMTTLVYQIRSTYEWQKSRRRQTTHSANTSEKS